VIAEEVTGDQFFAMTKLVRKVFALDLDSFQIATGYCPAVHLEARAGVVQQEGLAGKVFHIEQSAGGIEGYSDQAVLKLHLVFRPRG
jgi:hypothetical protein